MAGAVTQAPQDWPQVWQSCHQRAFDVAQCAPPEQLETLRQAIGHAAPAPKETEVNDPQANAGLLASLSEQGLAEYHRTGVVPIRAGEDLAEHGDAAAATSTEKADA